jgi:lipopolysaccharide export system protein LptA
LQGFSKNRHQQIKIEASSLEVQDKSKVATFRGKVQVKQGDTELRCDTLVVHYEHNGLDATSGSRATLPDSGTQRIRLLEAKGNVVVTQKDQIATGNAGVFDMRKNTITMRGNVVISQGRNVLRGDRLVVDMTTAVSRIESDRGRVQGLFLPSEKDKGAQRERGSIMPRIR